jgi:hypothetical protein
MQEEEFTISPKSRRAELVGQRFGRWLVVGVAKGSYVVCRCDCGTERPVNHRALRREKQPSRSCGCSYKPFGGTHTHPLYRVWCVMKERCSKPYSSSYGRYGAKGIRVCDRWINSFAAFVEDMGPRPVGYSIDRIDPTGNYEPGNCRWVSSTTQNRNRTDNRLLTFQGQTKTQSEWAADMGVPDTLIQSRLKRGWTVADALTIPIRARKPIRGRRVSQLQYAECPTCSRRTALTEGGYLALHGFTRARGKVVGQCGGSYARPCDPEKSA